MKSRGFTLIELLVVIAIIAILASIILVAVTRVQEEAEVVRTQSLIEDYKLGVEKFVGAVHKYPFVANADGTLNNDAGTDSPAQGVDDCWREMAPMSPDLTAGLQPSDANYRNKGLVECLSLDKDQMVNPGDGLMHVCDSWKKPFCMQWDFFNKKCMIWSAGADLSYDMSDNHVTGGVSSLFANQAQALANTPPVITPAIITNQVDLDLSNY
ncbi:MAG: prepilin-type N-terminal cleavage/methylation domain-containing protein [Planctomycetota bacterium]